MRQVHKRICHLTLTVHHPRFLSFTQETLQSLTHNRATHIQYKVGHVISIVTYLYENDYIDEKGNILQDYHTDMDKGTLAPMSKKLQPIEEQVHKLIQSIFDPAALEDMVEDANGKAEVVNERLNDNAEKKEFKALWNEINHRYVYTVHYDSEELIQKAIAAINSELSVTQLKYVVTTGTQGTDDLDFTGEQSTRTKEMRDVSTSNVPYDLVGDIAKAATLTRRTVTRILKGIQRSKLYMFKNNPEEFIRKVSHIIREQKATMIVEHISYNRTENQYDSDICTFWIMSSLTAKASVLSPKTWTKRMKCVSMPNCRGLSISLHP